MIIGGAKLAARIGVSAGERWLAVRGFRHADESEPPVCWTDVYVSGICRNRSALAAPYRN
jgi:GntR family transcriptional regulator